MFMANTAEMTERHGKVLADLAEIGMCIAREVQGQVLAAETPEEKARAAAAFPPVARAVRQTVALEAKLRRDQARQDREDQDEANRQIAGAIRRRKAQVRMHMQRAICNAFPDALDEDDDGPPDDILLRFEDLRDRLDDEILDADFALRPFHEVIAGLHRSLKLPPPEDLAEEADDDPDPPTSSPPGEAERGEGRERGGSAAQPPAPGPAMTPAGP
jgi:hypothetical protein